MINIVFLLFAISLVLFGKGLPTPFFHDKWDTLQDFFNTMFHGSTVGTYTEWRSVYLPLVPQFLNFFGAGAAQSSSFDLRDNYTHLYLLIVLLTLGAHSYTWHKIFDFKSSISRQLFLLTLTNPGFWFLLERGNLLVLAYPLLPIIYRYKVGVPWAISTALLVNLKIYFAALFLLNLRNNLGIRSLVLATFFVAASIALTMVSYDDTSWMFIKNITIYEIKLQYY